MGQILLHCRPMSKESKAFNVQHLDIAAFAQGEHTLQGQTPQAAYPRFAEEVLGDPAAESVTWHAQGQWQAQTGGAGHAWLVLEVHTQATLTCQRCLQPVEVPLEVQRDFRFVKDEATAQAQDDYSEEDLLVMSRDFDLQTLIEDELLMALPLVPQHGICPQPLAFDDAAAHVEDAPEKPHPFAALAQLRKAGDSAD